MPNAQKHIRDTFLAGVFAGVPIVVTVIIISWVDEKTQVLAEPLFQRRIPLLGVVIAIAAIYLIGLIVRSLLGRSIIAAVDGLLRRMPIIKSIYEAWKQVSLTPGGKEGMFAKAVLIPMEGGHQMLGFTSGESLPGQPEMLAIFIPNAPNPITGRLCFTHRDRVSFLNITTEEALKLVISSGNYLPPNLTQNTSTARNVVGSNTQ